MHNITNTLTRIYLPKNESHRIRPNSLSSFQCPYCLNTCEIPLSNTHPIPSYVIITCKTQIKQSKLRRHSLSRLIDFTTWHLTESLIEYGITQTHWLDKKNCQLLSFSLSSAPGAAPFHLTPQQLTDQCCHNSHDLGWSIPTSRDSLLFCTFPLDKRAFAAALVTVLMPRSGGKARVPCEIWNDNRSCLPEHFLGVS